MLNNIQSSYLDNIIILDIHSNKIFSVNIIKGVCYINWYSGHLNLVV